MTGRHLIFNADDFGASTGVNRGIIECHQTGVVTSASLMVTGRAVDEAIELSIANPRLAVGLHWDVWGEDEREFDLTQHQAVRDEFCRQLERFQELTGRLPTHIDSHRHAHLEQELFPLFLELVEPIGIPLRGDGKVNFVGGFYAQWEWMITDLAHVSVEALQGMLREEVPVGWTEFSCHPGYRSPDYEAVYLDEREAEVATLTHPAIADTIDALNIHLSSYTDFTTEAQI